MPPHSTPTGFRDSLLAWTLVLSAGLHVLAMVLIPNIRWEELKTPEVLQVELALPQKVPEP
ncbi:MAG TPA: hypothetical protein VFF75_04330, partial [Methylophilaceae bacterium]|nr:hypothetical protein [Methylophilaceae bacterium]